MQVINGTVVVGRAVVQGAVLPEGALVTVLTRGESQNFSLSAEEEDEMLEAMAEIERGERQAWSNCWKRLLVAAERWPAGS